MHATAPPRSYRFGGFALLMPEQLLVCGGKTVPLGGRARALLLALLRRAGALATKDELLAEAWPQLVVEEANLHVQVSQLRKVLGEEAIATVQGRGYRFALPLQEEPAHEAPPAAAAGPGAVHPMAMVVLPLAAAGSLADGEDFAEALTDAVACLLARRPRMHVVSHQAVQDCRREPFVLRQLAQRLAVRFALQGRIDPAEGGIAASVRLVDAASGALLWTDAFTLAASAAARQEAAARVAHGCTLALLQAQGRRFQPDAVPNATDLLLRAGALAHTARSAHDFDAALALVDAAHAVDPAQPDLLAYRARILASRVQAWPEPGDAERIDRAGRDIDIALRHDAANAIAHCTLARVRVLQSRMGAALTAVDHAVELEPHCVEALAWQGIVRVLHGQPGVALRPLQQALQLAPRDPHRWGPLFWLGKAHLLCGRYEESVRWLERSAAVLPFWATHGFLAAANGHLGRASESRAAIDAAGGAQCLLAQSRRVRVSPHPVYRALRLRHYVGGLVRAGVPAADQGADDGGFRSL